MSQSYEVLIKRVRCASDEERQGLLEELIAQFAGAAYHWALLVLDDENAALDTVQEAWLNAYLHLDQLREPMAFPSWFRQIVIASAHHTRRSEKSTIPLSDEGADAMVTPDATAEIEQRERQEQVWEAVQALPDHERVITELFYFADISQQEIADTLAIPLTTVKKRLQYARQRLKGIIQPDILASLYGLNDMPDEPPETFCDWTSFAMAASGLSQQVDSTPVFPFPNSVNWSVLRQR